MPQLGGARLPNGPGTEPEQLMAGKNWCGLFIDESAGLSGATLSGILYAGNSYGGAWGQVLQLSPSPL